MNEVAAVPVDLSTGFIDRLNTICKSNTSTISIGTDITVTDINNKDKGLYGMTLCNTAKDVSLDILFKDSVITILFNKYRVNPYLLHRGCKVVFGDTASLVLSIPIGVSQWVIYNTLNYLSELIYQCFDYTKFKT